MAKRKKSDSTSKFIDKLNKKIFNDKEIKASIRAAQGMADEAIQSMDEALEILDATDMDSLVLDDDIGEFAGGHRPEPLLRCQPFVRTVFIE